MEDYSIPNKEESDWASSLGLIHTVEQREFIPLNTTFMLDQEKKLQQ